MAAPGPRGTYSVTQTAVFSRLRSLAKGMQSSLHSELNASNLLILTDKIREKKTSEACKFHCFNVHVFLTLKGSSPTIEELWNAE